jgi:hypothetical protein
MARILRQPRGEDFAMKPSTGRIPRDSWPEWFEQATSHYGSWKMTIEVFRDDLGDQVVASEVPLRMLTFEAKASKEEAFLIDGLDWRSNVLQHRIDGPRNVWVRETRPGAESAILIESGDKTVTLVMLRRPMALPSHH